ncbi:hypothetical protein GALL_276120 [mine drainage metagenome]|uniref:ATPase AAA-type core domain-containing protein n=1 Tax=mine drainage metagenome TaxID=410659 RepID=A0A1J5R3G9_9ZZZZ
MTENAKPRIEKIQVRGLFGLFNHDISILNRDRITILHGVNGCGKTTVLRMIDAICSSPIDTSVFQSVVFESFKVDLSDESQVVVSHKALDESTQGALRFYYRPKVGEVIDTILVVVPGDVLNLIDRHVPRPYSRYRHGWHVRGEDRIFTLTEIVKMFPEVVSAVPKQYRDATDKIPSLEIAPVYFVETKRLEANRPASHRQWTPGIQGLSIVDDDDEPGFSSRVDQYSNDIVTRIKSVISDYAQYAQERDRTFPARLVEFIRQNGPMGNAKEILAELDKLEDARLRLISLGLVDAEVGLPKLEEADLNRALAPLVIYVEDVHKKLEIFSDFSNRLGMLIDMLNSRFKYKKIMVNKSSGFILKSPSGNLIPLSALSSGEQHELVVYYDLIFRAPSNGLVLVDEPEISLHVGWQSRFLDDFKRILELTNCYGVIATHSPTIIGSRWDLTVELQVSDQVGV